MESPTRREAEGRAYRCMQIDNRVADEAEKSGFEIEICATLLYFVQL